MLNAGHTINREQRASPQRLLKDSSTSLPQTLQKTSWALWHLPCNLCSRKSAQDHGHRHDSSMFTPGSPRLRTSSAHLAVQTTPKVGLETQRWWGQDGERPVEPATKRGDQQRDLIERTRSLRYVPTLVTSISGPL